MNWYLFLRLFLWLVGALVSAYPALQSTGAAVLTWPPDEVANAVNSSGHFRDLFFVIVATAFLEVTVVIEFLARPRKPREQRMIGFVLFLLILNLIALGSSLVGFTQLGEGRQVEPQWLHVVSDLIYTGLAIGCFTEVSVAWIEK